MFEPICPSCKTSISNIEEQPLNTRRSGEILLMCCPSCHVVLGIVKARPVERVFEDAGRQVVDVIGRLADKMQTR